MTVAEKLIKARGDRTRENVADAVGVSVSAIGMYENGSRIPRDEIKVKLADFFGVSVQDLFLTRIVTKRDNYFGKRGENQ